MENYIGVKVIKAEAMNLYEYSMNIKGVDCKEENQDGFLVEYPQPDGSTYKSWSPKDVFEMAYRKIEEFEIDFMSDIQ